jgi:tyrosyl-tRNA synthetase
VKCADIARALTSADLLFGKHVLLRKGKRTYAVLSLTAVKSDLSD